VLEKRAAGRVVIGNPGRCLDQLAPGSVAPCAPENPREMAGSDLMGVGQVVQGLRGQQ